MIKALGYGALALALIGGACLGYVGGSMAGHSRGIDDARAQANATAVKDLTGIIDSHQALVTDANAASQAMRDALAKRAAHDTKTTKELKNALAPTAASRANCRFDDDVMRQLTAARDRAAAVAAGGIRGQLPGTGSSGEQSR